MAAAVAAAALPEDGWVTKDDAMEALPHPTPVGVHPRAAVAVVNAAQGCGFAAMMTAEEHVDNPYNYDRVRVHGARVTHVKVAVPTRATEAKIMEWLGSRFVVMLRRVSGGDFVLLGFGTAINYLLIERVLVVALDALPSPQGVLGMRTPATALFPALADKIQPTRRVALEWLGVEKHGNTPNFPAGGGGIVPIHAAP